MDGRAQRVDVRIDRLAGPPAVPVRGQRLDAVGCAAADVQRPGAIAREVARGQGERAAAGPSVQRRQAVHVDAHQGIAARVVKYRVERVGGDDPHTRRAHRQRVAAHWRQRRIAAREVLSLRCRRTSSASRR